jgi:iron(III) transport system substrate-binding protein
MTIELANEGLLEPYDSPATRDWPKKYRDENNRWYGFAARARVIAYAPDRIPSDNVPKTWMELTQERFKNRIVMADPRFGTTGGHLAVMKVFWDHEVMPGYFEAFIEGLATNHTRMLPSGNAGVVEAIAKGEADIGLTDTDDVWAAQAQELNIAFVYPNHSTEKGATGIGTLLIPNTVGLIKGGPHPQPARELMEFLLSEQVERTLAKSVSHNIPLRAKLAGDFADEIPPDPLKVDYVAVAAERKKAIQECMDIFEKVRQEEAAPAPEPRPENPPHDVDGDDDAP